MDQPQQVALDDGATVRLSLHQPPHPLQAVGVDSLQHVDQGETLCVQLSATWAGQHEGVGVNVVIWKPFIIHLQLY